MFLEANQIKKECTDNIFEKDMKPLLLVFHENMSKATMKCISKSVFVVAVIVAAITAVVAVHVTIAAAIVPLSSLCEMPFHLGGSDGDRDPRDDGRDGS